jgi:hypothetical protein
VVGALLAGAWAAVVEGVAVSVGAADGPVIAGAPVELVAGATVLLLEGSVDLSLLLQPDIRATAAAADDNASTAMRAEGWEFFTGGGYPVDSQV